MIVFCEECGERIIIDPGEIRESVIIMVCRKCSDVIRITVPDEAVQGLKALKA
jgi:DNA-directed RNA polymerase subunit M/transcription elongation factor TFIIS